MRNVEAHHVTGNGNHFLNRVGKTAHCAHPGGCRGDADGEQLPPQTGGEYGYGTAPSPTVPRRVSPGGMGTLLRRDCCQFRCQLGIERPTHVLPDRVEPAGRFSRSRALRIPGSQHLL